MRRGQCGRHGHGETTQYPYLFSCEGEWGRDKAGSPLAVLQIRKGATNAVPTQTACEGKGAEGKAVRRGQCGQHGHGETTQHPAPFPSRVDRRREISLVLTRPGVA